MYTGCKQRQEEIVKLFSTLSEKEARYLEIINFDRYLTPFLDSNKSENCLVQGCQSLLYVTATFEQTKIFYTAHSDSLISKGLAGLLSYIYSNEAPEAIFLCPPTFIQEIDLFGALSMNRSNGLKSLFTQMQKLAVPYIK
jgi:cysteine desulfuration protein SufE